MLPVIMNITGDIVQRFIDKYIIGNISVQYSGLKV